MTVATALRSWSATAANNSPKGTDVIGTSADDELRTIQAVVRQYLASQSSTVAPSAGVADLTTATGHWVPVSGSSTLTGLGSEDAGIEYVLNFTGAPILVHSTALQLPGQATIQAGTSDACVAESLGSGNWRLWGFSSYSTPPKIPQAKAWARVTVSAGVPTLQENYNVASVTDNGTGDWTLTFSTALASANYIAVATTLNASAGAGGIAIKSKLAASVRVIVSNRSTGSATDAVDGFDIVCFGG